MPSKYSLDQLPPTIQNEILLAKVPSRLMAVISFNGVANDLLLGKKLSELKNECKMKFLKKFLKKSVFLFEMINSLFLRTSTSPSLNLIKVNVAYYTIYHKSHGW